MGFQVAAALTSLLVLTATLRTASAGKEDCPVCNGALEKLFETVENKSDMAGIEKAIDDYCEKAEGKEVKLCYSISTIKREISKPASMGLPIDRICEKLGKKDATICELRYPKPPTDLTTLKEEDIKKMRVKQLKELLQEYNKECKGCAEKQEFVSEVMALRATKLKSDL